MTNETATQRPRDVADEKIRQWFDSGTYSSGDRLPSQRDLAEQLGVSRTTIRTVLKNLEEEGLVRSGPSGSRRVTKKAINGADVLADTVAVLTSAATGPPKRSGQTTGWEEHIYAGIMARLRERNRHGLTLASSRVLEQDVSYLLSHSFRGVVAFRSFADTEHGVKVLREIAQTGLPLAVFGDLGQVKGVDTVISDQKRGGYELTRWLIERGCRRILPFGFGYDPYGEDATPWVRQRLAGYRDAMEEATLEPCEPVGSFDVFHVDGGPIESFDPKMRLCVGFLLEHLQGDDPVDAVMTASDGLVPPVTAAVQRLGKEPQRDVMVVGYDNYWSDVPETKIEPTPPAATVDKRNPEIGAALVDLVEERAAGKLAPEPQRRVVQPELVVFSR